MFGLKSNYENKLFINGEQVVGIESIDINYSNSPVNTKVFGTRKGLTTVGSTVQQKLSITKNLIQKDSFFDYINEQSYINGNIEYDGNSYGFNSGYLEEYVVNCAVGSLPKVTANIGIYDEMKTGILTNSPNQSSSKIFIPTQGSISINCDHSTTNRVIGFDYAIKSYLKPIYTIGSKLPSEIVLFPVLEYSASVQIDVDDAFLKNGLSFLENREEKSVSLAINGGDGSLMQSLNIPNASLTSESLSSTADGGVKLTLNYIGHDDVEDLALDFEFGLNKSLVPRIGETLTLQRNSQATFVGSDGLIQSAANNTARFEHHPVTLVCKGLLVEGARTNLITKSSHLSSAPWSAENGATLTSGFLAPDGSLDAVKITGGLDAATQQSNLTITNKKFIFSFFLKKGSSDYVKIKFNNGQDLFESRFIFSELKIEHLTGVIGYTTKILNFNNGWYRIVFTFNTGRDSSDASCFIGLGQVGDVYAWGAQLEAGDDVSSYIFSDTSPTLRNKDICSLLNNFSSFYNEDAGTVFIKCFHNSRDIIGSSISSATVAFGGDQNGIVLNLSEDERGIFASIINDEDTSSQQSIERVLILGDEENQLNKVLMAFKNEGSSIISANGQISSQTNGVLLPSQKNAGATPTSLQLFSNHFSIINSFRYYRKRLSNEKIKKMTSL